MTRAQRGRNEGSVYKRKLDGLRVGVVSLGYDGNGKRKRRVVYGATKRAAAEELRRLQTKSDAGQLAEPNSLTVESWLTL